MKIRSELSVLLLLTFILASPPARGEPEGQLRGQAREAILKGVAFFHHKVSTQGGYASYYSEDLSQRRGWGADSPTKICIRPPGTPSVALSYLRAYQVTGDKRCLDAALAAGRVLARCQLASGGWISSFDLSPEAEDTYFLRAEASEGRSRLKAETDTASLFDNDSQLPLRLLMILDHLAGEEELKNAAGAGLDLLLKSQFPNGAWPKRYPLAEDDHTRWYTFNDNLINNCVSTLLDAYAIYGNPEYLKRAKVGADFMLKSQLGSPQSGWAQQYDYKMKPAWGRRFEPPGVNSWVTARNIRTLVLMFLETGDEKYIQTIPAAVEWLEGSQIGLQRWARFYEVGTNRPVYMNSQYEVTYSDSDLPTHYAFQGSYYIPETIASYYRLRVLGPEIYRERRRIGSSDFQTRTMTWALENRVRDICSRQDSQGRWVTGGRITTPEFIANILELSDYLELTGDGSGITLPVEVRSIPLRGGSPGDESFGIW